jgi:hypothetical protein
MPPLLNAAEGGITVCEASLNPGNVERPFRDFTIGGFHVAFLREQHSAFNQNLTAEDAKVRRKTKVREIFRCEKLRRLRRLS